MRLKSFTSNMLAALTPVFLIGVTGCQPMAYKLTPIPADQRLTETELARDPGAFVHAKVAVIDVVPVMVIASLLFSLSRSPLQPAKVHPGSADAVSVTTSPCL